MKTFTKKYNVNIIDYQSFSFSKAYDVKITNAIRLSSQYTETKKSAKNNSWHSFFTIVSQNDTPPILPLPSISYNITQYENLSRTFTS